MTATVRKRKKISTLIFSLFPSLTDLVSSFNFFDKVIEPIKNIAKYIAITKFKEANHDDTQQITALKRKGYIL